MSVRQRHKPRFTVDVVRPSETGSLARSAAGVRRRKKPRFRVDLPESATLHAFAPSAAVARRRAVRQTFRTLAQRRQVRRATVFVGVVCIILITIMAGVNLAPQLGTYLTHPHTQGASPGKSTARAAVNASPDRVLRNQPVLPFPPLRTHIAAGSQPPAIQAKSAFVFDPSTGWIFYEKNADELRSTASLTKIMTMLLAVNSGNLDQVVTVGPDAAALVNSNNSYMGVSAGEQLTLRDLLYGLIVASGNDAAVAIADQIGGSEAAFVAMMNNEARQLGLNHTVFVSPDGANDANMSSARDLAVLSAVAMMHPEVEQIVSTQRYTIPQTPRHKAYDMFTNNELLPGGPAAYTGANGIKGGFTGKAGYCMAFSARQQGHLIIGVTLGDPSAQARTADATTLLNWGFSQDS